jgi:hypothetical protein
MSSLRAAQRLQAPRPPFVGRSGAFARHRTAGAQRGEQHGPRKERHAMNAIAEPIELLEAECYAQGWYQAEEREPEEDDVEAFDVRCSERVLEWTVERICACPSFCRNPES